MPKFVKWRAKPSCEQNTFPTKRPAIVVLGNTLEPRQNNAKGEKYAKQPGELDGGGFEESEEESVKHWV